MSKTTPFKIVSPLSPGDEVYRLVYGYQYTNCSNCEGSGYVERPGGYYDSYNVQCSKCSGGGRVKASDNTKWLCDGMPRKIKRLAVYSSGISVDFDGVSWGKDLYPIDDCFSTIAKASDEALKRNKELAQARK
jgi:hypothetical protein